MVNWHKRQLKLIAVQCGGPKKKKGWVKAVNKAANKFFGTKIDNSGVDAYTGRIN